MCPSYILFCFKKPVLQKMVLIIRVIVIPYSGTSYIFDKWQKYLSGRTHRHCDASGKPAWMLYPKDVWNRPQIDSNASDLVCVQYHVCSFWCTLLLFITASLASKCFLFSIVSCLPAESGHIWTVWREYLCFSFPLLYVSFFFSFASVVCHRSSVSIILVHLILSQRGLRKSLTLCLTSKGRAREGQPDQDAVWASRAVHNRNGKECCAHRGAEETGKERYR